MSTVNDLHHEVQHWRNRAILAESRLAILEKSIQQKERI